MILTPELWIAILNFGTKFGIDAAMAIAQGIKGGKTIDDAITALDAAKSKTAADYLKEAQAAAAATAATTPTFAPLPTPPVTGS